MRIVKCHKWLHLGKLQPCLQALGKEGSNLQCKNALAYGDTELITTVKSFIVQIFGDYVLIFSCGTNCNKTIDIHIERQVNQLGFKYENSSAPSSVQFKTLRYLWYMHNLDYIMRTL
jgi:hypothetical protein